VNPLHAKTAKVQVAVVGDQPEDIGLFIDSMDRVDLGTDDQQDNREYFHNGQKGH
jgi:hypothetical protein